MKVFRPEGEKNGTTGSNSSSSNNNSNNNNKDDDDSNNVINDENDKEKDYDKLMEVYENRKKTG